MKIKQVSFLAVKFLCFFYFFSVLIFSCKGDSKKIGEKEIVEEPAQINITAAEIIKESLEDILENHGRISDSIHIKNTPVVQFLYETNSYEPLWTNNGQWTNKGDSLFSLIQRSNIYGLFRQDYYAVHLTELHEQLKDTSNKEIALDAALWAEADLLMSSAFTQIIRDVKLGRLYSKEDKKPDSLVSRDFYPEQFKNFNEQTTDSFISALEPFHEGYKRLREELPNFLDTADLKRFSYILIKDSANLKANVYRRLSEEDTLITDAIKFDSAALSKAISRFQKRRGIKQDGKISSSLVNALNNTDYEKFIRIAITLDRFKQMPDSLPPQYIWVNIPSYNLNLFDSGEVKLSSKIVVGKPETRTPIITSAISDMITYPQWTIPTSIIKKEILPGLQRDTNYTRKKGYMILDKDGNEINPGTINWAKYKEGIPYKVIQGSGDDNALGVLKFNFPNKHSVYLHDTNQRYLFSRTKRSLSHGCVRVQNWQELAYYIIANDSLKAKTFTPSDSLTTWLAAKQKHVIPVRKRIPLFIRYFSVAATEEGIKFYEDVYGEDRKLREKFFSDK